MRACSSAEGREVLSGVKPSYSCLKERSRDYCPQDRDLWAKRHHTHKKSNVPIYVIWEGIFPVHHISKLIILNQMRHFCPFLNPVWRVRRGSCGFSKQRKLFMSSPGGFVIHLSVAVDPYPGHHVLRSYVQMEGKLFYSQAKGPFSLHLFSVFYSKLQFLRSAMLRILENPLMTCDLNKLKKNGIVVVTTPKNCLRKELVIIRSKHSY